VVPAKVTAAPVCSFCRSIVLEGGAETLESTMFVHDLTADEMEAKLVTVQAVPAAPATVVVGGGVLLGTELTDVVRVVGRCDRLVSVLKLQERQSLTGEQTAKTVCSRAAHGTRSDFILTISQQAHSGET
jgi:hypothetical protein